MGPNRCPITLSSEDGNSALCIWQCPSTTTKSQFEAFIEKFTQGFSTNKAHKVEAATGLANVNFETYAKDLQKLSKDGHVFPYCGSGSLFFVRHNIQDQEGWNQWMSGFPEAYKSKPTPEQFWEMAKVPRGVACVATLMFPEGEGAMCIWNCPKQYSEEDFQKFVDGFTGKISMNSPVWKVVGETAVGARNLHPDVYAMDGIESVANM